ncbi:hypothetical protein [Streptomyces sp. SID5910]|uniref:hypothetical protein n=1 Tax=Streptomyces sp. SID5910 TaxID=2690312 RepID=UPI001367EAEA|nr:hypothetical protein [Streptomyces sp. SID5910]MYR43052.1 hypothetical protein [Streptomyces sp. SID5910]
MADEPDRHWYDNGGMLPASPRWIRLPDEEHVFTAEQWGALTKKLADLRADDAEAD